MSNVQAVKDNARGLFSALCALGAQATQSVVAKVAEGANAVNAKLQAAAATSAVAPASASSDPTAPTVVSTPVGTIVQSAEVDNPESIFSYSSGAVDLDRVKEVARKEYEAYLLSWQEAIEEDGRRTLCKALKLQNS